MNPCILITSHLNSPEKRNLALENLKFFQNKSLPIVLAGNFPLAPELQKEADYTLFINSNPILGRISYAWKMLPPNTFGENLKGIISSQDYGYAHLDQTLKGFKFCQSLGFDYVYHFNYDTFIDDQEYDRMLSSTQKYTPMIFPWGDNAISTATYGFKTSDFIKALEPRMHYYANCNPPLPPNWFCEVFFKWVLEDSQIIQNVDLSSIKVELKASNTQVVTSLGTFSFYYNPPTNSYLVLGDSTSSFLSFRVNDQYIVAESIGKNCFELASIEGEYYLETSEGLVYMFTNTPEYRSYNYVQTT